MPLQKTSALSGACSQMCNGARNFKTLLQDPILGRWRRLAFLLVEIVCLWRYNSSLIQL